MPKSETIGAIAKALSTVQSKLQPAIKDSSNPFFKSQYADLNSVWDACRALLAANDLAVAQSNQLCENGVVVETMLMHSSGEWISGELFLPLVKNDPQGVGSAITYGRRYGLAAMIGIVADVDDDGNAASQQKTTAKQPPAAVNPNQRAELTARITKARAGVKAAGGEVENLDLSKMSDYDLAKYLDKLNAQYKSLQEKAK